MVFNDIDKYVLIGKEKIIYSDTNLNKKIDLQINYRIDEESKEIRLYNVPRILEFKEKMMIYYAILNRYYFDTNDYMYDKIEEYVVRENGYTYHEFYSIEGEAKGILSELLFEIPRQELEPEKLSRIRDIYDMLILNLSEVGIKPICISFMGSTVDFKDVYKVIEYMFKYDDKLVKIKDSCKLYRRYGIFGGNKRIFIIPKEVITNEVLDENNEEKLKAKAMENKGTT